MPVRAKNIKSVKTVNVEINVVPVDLMSECVAVLTLHLREETQNISEASRCIARARIAGIDLSTVQKRCFDANVSGTLMKRAFALSKDHTEASLARADAAVNTLQRNADHARQDKAREQREKANNAPLKVKAFAGLTLG